MTSAIELRTVSIGISLLGLCAASSPVQATLFDCTYNGGTNNWSTTGAWSSCNLAFPSNNADTFNAAISTGAVTLDQNIVIEALDFSGGIITGDFNLTLNNTFTWTGGTLAGAGVTRAEGDMVISDGATKFFNNTRELVNAAGSTATWSEGEILILGTGSTPVISNEAGGTFNVTGDSRALRTQFSGFISRGTFNNAGSFNVNLSDAGQTLTLSDTDLNNSGSVDVQTGTLVLSGSDVGSVGGGTSTGSFDATGAVLEFAGGSQTLQSGAAVTGTELRFSGGTTTFESGASYNVTEATVVNGGSAIFNSGSTVTNLGNTLTLSAGSLDIGTTASAGTTDISGGGLAGDGTLTASGLLTWTGGTLAGAGVTRAEGDMVISDGATKFFNNTRELVNAAGSTATWSEGEILILGTGSTPVISNEAGGTFNVTGDSRALRTQFSGFISRGTFNNAGSFNVNLSDAGQTLTLSDTDLNNSGSVDVQTGTLVLSGSDVGSVGGGTSTGSFDATGAVLEFAGGSQTLQSGAAVTGTELRFSGGTTTFESGASYNVTEATVVNGGSAIFNSGSTVTNLGNTLTLSAGSLDIGTTASAGTTDISGGGLAGDGTLTASGLLTWTGGTLAGAGVTRAEGDMVISGSATKFFNNTRELVNAAGSTATWSEGEILILGTGSTPVISNEAGGTFNVTGDSRALRTQFSGFISRGTFNNAGSFNVNLSDAGQTLTLSDTDLNNSGSVDVQTGTLVLSGSDVGSVGGGTSTGSFDATGAVLEFAGGSQTLQSGAAVTGTELRFSGGTTTFESGASYNVTEATVVNGGSAIFNSGSTVTNLGNTLTLSAGSLDIGTTASAGTTDISGGGLAGDGTLTASGLLTWTGGTLAGAGVTRAEGDMVISDGATKFFNNTRELVNAAGSTATWSEGEILILGTGSTPVISNEAGGTFNVTGDSRALRTQFSGFISRGTFNNAGSFNVNLSDAGQTLTLSDTDLNNSGSVDVQTGTLVLSGSDVGSVGGGTSTGSFDATGAVLEFAGGSQTLQSGAAVTGTELRFSGGTTTFESGASYNVTEATVVNGGSAIFNSGSTVTNLGNTLTLSAGSLDIGTTASAGTTDISGGGLAGDGTLTASGLLTWTGGTLAGAGVTRAEGDMVISDGATKFFNNTRELVNAAGSTATWSEGEILILGTGSTPVISNEAGGTFNVTGDSRALRTQFSGFISRGTFNNAGSFNVNLSDAGQTLTLSDTDLNNSGSVDVQQGILSTERGVLGPTGTVQIGDNGTLVIGAASNVGNLIHNGASADSLNLGSNDITVHSDYNNANFNVGNSYDRRANVVGTGQILAAGDVAQGVAGDIAEGPTTGDATIVFSNVHVGEATTQNYQISNVGTTGPSIRGAIQTSVNGGNIDDPRLSGTGVTASNFGPIAPGDVSGDLAVTLTADTVGLLSLNGQIVHVENNFDNLNAQDISITTATGATAFRFADPSQHTPEPVVLANVRVGDLAQQVLSISNQAVDDGFSESLNASFGGTSGDATAAGFFNLLGPTDTDNSNLIVGVDTASAGAKSGIATLNLVSDGEGSSGLGQTALADQLVNISGDVFRLAEASAHTPEPVVINARVGDAGEQLLTMTNTAVNDGYSESLNASIGSATGGATAAGAFNRLGAGATDNSNLVVGIDTSSAGAKSGTATISLESDGAGTSNIAGNVALTSQTVNVSGNVWAQAEAEVQPDTVDFGIVHVGDSVASQAVAVSNTATGALTDVVQGGFSAVDGPFNGSGNLGAGVAAGDTDNTSLTIGLDTGSAGVFSGTATLGLVSHDTDLADLALPDETVALAAQVNDFANPTFTFLSGDGTFSGGGDSFLLDFGTIQPGSAVSLSANLSLLNDVLAPADSLSGIFDLSDADVFMLSGFDDFSVLVPGASIDDLIVSLDPTLLGAGLFTGNVILDPTGFNESGFSGALDPITLSFRAQVVPVPAAVWLFGSGFIALFGIARRRRPQ